LAAEGTLVRSPEERAYPCARRRSGLSRPRKPRARPPPKELCLAARRLTGLMLTVMEPTDAASQAPPPCVRSLASAGRGTGGRP